MSGKAAKRLKSVSIKIAKDKYNLMTSELEDFQGTKRYKKGSPRWIYQKLKKLHTSNATLADWQELMQGVTI